MLLSFMLRQPHGREKRCQPKIHSLTPLFLDNSHRFAGSAADASLSLTKWMLRCRYRITRTLKLRNTGAPSSRGLSPATFILKNSNTVESVNGPLGISFLMRRSGLLRASLGLTGLAGGRFVAICHQITFPQQKSNRHSIPERPCASSPKTGLKPSRHGRTGEKSRTHGSVIPTPARVGSVTRITGQTADGVGRGRLALGSGVASEPVTAGLGQSVVLFCQSADQLLKVRPKHRFW